MLHFEMNSIFQVEMYFTIFNIPYACGERSEGQAKRHRVYVYGCQGLIMVANKNTLACSPLSNGTPSCKTTVNINISVFLSMGAKLNALSYGLALNCFSLSFYVAINLPNKNTHNI